MSEDDLNSGDLNRKVLGDMRRDLNDVRRDLNDLRTDVRDLQGLRTEVADLKTELGDFKVDVSQRFDAVHRHIHESEVRVTTEIHELVDLNRTVIAALRAKS